MKNNFFLIVVLLSLFSCETDFELNAPYKATPVVYGLLDQSVDTQFIKINKSFLGDGNNVSYAAINDCTLFDSLIAVIEAYDISNNLMRQDTLREIWVTDLEDGIFYEDRQKLYYFTTPNNSLNDEYEYHLKVNAPIQGLSFSAFTSLVDNGGENPSFNYLFRTNLLNGLSLNGIRFIDKVEIAEDNYVNQVFSWKSANNGERYELLLRFHFDEYFQDGSVVTRYVDWNLGTKKSNDANNKNEFEKTISGSAFYDMIASRLNSYSYESQVVKRTFEEKPLEFLLTVGNNTISTYMEVNEPVSGIVTEKPVFTNVENGIGVFASKYQCSIPLGMQDGTILELCRGTKTSAFKFCYELVSDIQGYNVSCPN
jgi:hypothetical protein